MEITYSSLDVRVIEPDNRRLFKRMIFGFLEDKKYHLCGYRPSDRDLGPVPNEDLESLADMGLLTLPAGKTRISDVVEGEELTITPKVGDPYKAEVVYITLNAA